MQPRHPRSTLFPYTTLFRSDDVFIAEGRASARPVFAKQHMQKHVLPGESKSRRKHPIHLPPGDRKSTRLNSSHITISYAVFCLKKKNKPTDDRSNQPYPKRQ